MWPFRFAMHRRRGLRMMVITLLESSPKNGVELMDGIEAMTRGWWRPSPGSIYPLLNDQLVREGLVSKREDGRYELTSKAKVELEVSFGSGFRRPHTIGDMISEMTGFVSYFEDLSKSNRVKLEPHFERIKTLSKRLLEITGKDDSPKESTT